MYDGAVASAIGSPSRSHWYVNERSGRLHVPGEACSTPPTSLSPVMAGGDVATGASPSTVTASDVASPTGAPS